jgi:hypothetical protein
MYLALERLRGSDELANFEVLNLIKELEQTIYREPDIFVKVGNIQCFAENFKKNG